LSDGDSNANMKRRNELIRRASLWGGGLLVGVLLLVLLVRALTGGAEQLKLASGHPATGQAVDGISCASEMASGQHYHVYLAIYANGQQMQVPPNTGILTSCMYALHVHQGQGMDNIIHIESPDKSATYTLGQFFDIWGQPLSRTQALGYTADATHPLEYAVIAEDGKLTKVTSDPRAIVLGSHETIAVLYNSAKVTPAPNTEWNGG
jgi:hypothetical protein